MEKNLASDADVDITLYLTHCTLIYHVTTYKLYHQRQVDTMLYLTHCKLMYHVTSYTLYHQPINIHMIKRIRLLKCVVGGITTNNRSHAKKNHFFKFTYLLYVVSTMYENSCHLKTTTSTSHS